MSNYKMRTLINPQNKKQRI